MEARQFGIRHLFVATFFVAVAIAGLQLCAVRFPVVVVFAVLASGVLALAGLAIICFTVVVALAIFGSADDGNRQFNLTKCRNLIGIGLLANLPLAIWFVVIPYL